MFHTQSTFILNLHSRTAGPSIHFVRRIWVWKHCYWSKFWHQKGAKSWLRVVTTTHNMGTDGLTFILRINNNETQTHLRDDNGDCWKAVLSMLAGHPLSWNGIHKVTKPFLAAPLNWGDGTPLQVPLAENQVSQHSYMLSLWSRHSDLIEAWIKKLVKR